MPINKRAAIYARVSTTHQNVDNQLLELRETAKRFGWIITHEIVDDGISGAKGRDRRPGFDKLFRMIQKKEIDVVMAWSIDRLGRSIVDLTSFMGEIQSTGVDLYIEKQAINTQSASGRMIFGIFAALGEYEREIIKERIHAGLNRARQNGVRLGRPSIANSPTVISSVRLLREKQMPIHQIARSLKIGVGTVSKILAAA